MILAAIDAGSNAIRLQINRVLLDDHGEPHFKSLEYIRFPLRLGKDTFRTGEITFRSETKFVNLMMAFRTLIDLYEADDAYGCATSALRDALNGERIIRRAYEKSGLHIDLISGQREAELLDLAIHQSIGEGNYITIDVGGGSTEINLTEGKNSYARKSFKLGSVRNMQGKEKKETWEEMSSWIKEHIIGKDHLAVGTGGNIKSYQKIIDNSRSELTFSELESTIAGLGEKTISERINGYELREDRADVIVFAGEIYKTAMQYAGAEKILVPDVGLKDGIIHMLFERNR